MSLRYNEETIKNFKESLEEARKGELLPMIRLTPGWVRAIDGLLHDWEVMHKERVSE